jgi:ABC-type branched-subunit amino acid transport system substrate-binding protein
MMQSLGYKFIYERAVSPTEADFTADILRMKNLGVQYFNFTNLNIQDVARVLNAAQQQNWHPQVLDANTACDANLLKLVNPGAAENVTSEQYWLMFLGQDRRANAEVNTYLTWLDETKPGFPPDFFTFYSWVSMALFIQALKAAGPNPNQEDLVTAIRAIHSFNDNGFIATADPGDRKPATCWSRLILKNGQWVHDTPPTATYQCTPSGYFYYQK